MFFTDVEKQWYVYILSPPLARVSGPAKEVGYVLRLLSNRHVSGAFHA